MATKKPRAPVEVGDKVLVDGTVTRVAEDPDIDGKWLVTIQISGTGNRETMLNGYRLKERADA